MEYLISGGVLGLAYWLRNADSKENKKILKVIPKSQKPSGETVYTSKRAYNIFQGEQEQANKLFQKSLYPQDTNVVTPGPTLPIVYNKVDYNEKKLPVEFNMYQTYENALIDEMFPAKKEPVNLAKDNSSFPETGGWSGISLTGDPINPSAFTHNNMIPFFGSNVRQNVDEYSTHGIFENFTGTQDNYKKKQEISPLFVPQKNVTNVYGQGSLDGFMLDRYYVSNIRSNETPVERVYVGPGLNQGYTAEPSGGFQQADALDYAMPKTTDEIRVKTNPKISYNGRIVSGQKIAKPGKIGTVFKNHPDTFYIQNPDRYLTTTGQVIAPEQRPCIVTKYTNRKTTELKTRKGSAAPVHGTVANVRSKYRVSNKVSYTDNGPRNASTTDQWSIFNVFADYGKKNIRLKDTTRSKNVKSTPVMNVKSVMEKGTARNGQTVKVTKKQEMIHNTHSGNFQSSVKKSIVYDPADLPRRTVKQTTVENRNPANVAHVSKGAVYNPDEIARRTIKETQIDNTHEGMIQTSVSKSVAYDPSDIARRTIKETQIDNTHEGMIQSEVSKGVVYDPNDIARRTIKETNIDNTHEGMLQPSVSKGIVYDPEQKTRPTMKQTTIYQKRKANPAQPQRSVMYYNEDPARTTIKQFTMVENAVGIATQPRDDGYALKEVQASETNRQTTSVEYTGDATGPELGAYEVTEVVATNTNRQFTADTEYIGGAGNDGHNGKPMSYEDVYNATMRSIRSLTDEGYTPGAAGPSQGMDPTDIHVNTSRIGDIQNTYLTERGVQSNKVYNSIPQMSMCNITQDKETLPNDPLADRINPVILKALDENPYSQPLNSWA